MDEPTQDEANPLKPVEDEPKSTEQTTAQEEVGQTKQSTIEEKERDPQKNEPGKSASISPEMAEELKRLLRNTNRGKGLMVRLDAIGRPDLYKNQTNVLWIKDIQAIEIKLQPFDLNPGLFEQFRSYCWNNAMTYRFDDTSGVVVLIVRWFLPDVLPVMDPELSKFAMAAPINPEPAILKRPTDLKEVK